MERPQSTTPPTSPSPSTVTTAYCEPLDTDASSPCLRKSSADASPTHPLFQLPRELRDRIYTEALSSPYPITWPNASQYHSINPALVRTSRQLHAEAAPVLYKANTLSFAHPSDANMFHWTSAAAHSRSVASVVLHIRDREVRLWTAYLGSTSPHRSLTADFPALARLHVVFRSLFWALLDGDPAEKFVRWMTDHRLRELCLSLEKKTPDGCRASMVCVQRVPKREVVGLCRDFPKEIRVVEEVGCARTAPMGIFGVAVVLELWPVDPPIIG